MGGLVLAIFYGSIIFCIVTFLIKLYRYAKLPLPLRSEIYKEGSIYEQASWWPRSGTSIKGKFKAALIDILALSGYYHHNKRFWFVLYPFHLGIYLLILWHVWLFIFPLVAVNTGSLDYALIWGHIATGLIFTGALGILIQRIADKKLRASYPRWNYFKWAFIILALGSGLVAVQYYFNGSMVDVIAYVKYQLAFDMQAKLNPPLMTSLHVLAVSAVLIYLPLNNHTMRVFFRNYQKIRWDSIPNVEGGRVDKATRGQLRYPMVWSASHIPAVKAWKDL